MMAMRISPPQTKLRRYHMLDNVNSRTFTPREYQVELLDAARKHNTIVCLATGSGKTFIAVMVIKELAYQIRGSFDDDDVKRTIFIVPTVPLVHQQTKILEDYTDLRVGKYCGFEFSTWTKDMWLSEFRKNGVLVLTPDIFKMLLLHGFLSLRKINLLIFDECHRAVRNHPYCEIMKCFDVCPPENQPRILGLSASLVNGKCKPCKVGQQIKNLEKILQSTVETASDLTVSSKYGAKPQEYLVLYRPYPSSSLALINMLAHLNSVLGYLENVNIPWDCDEESLPHPTKQPRRYMMEISHVVVTLGPWCAKLAIELFLREIHRMLDAVYSTQHRQFLVLVQTTLLIALSYCEKMLAGKDTLSQLLAYVPPKLEKLLKVLERYKPSDLLSENNHTAELDEIERVDFQTTVNSCKHETASDSCPSCKNAVQSNLCVDEGEVCESAQNQEKADSNQTPAETDQKPNIVKKYNNACQQSVEDSKALCGVIFVKQRVTAYLLNQWLCAISKNNPDFSFISSNCISGHGKTGGGASNSKDSTMVFRKQEEVLQKFRAREYNLIVCTAVVEEGMDIPKCNLVLHFDTPENFRSYIQSKGRARAPDSLYAVMVQDDEEDKTAASLCDFKIIEEILLEKCHKSDSTIDEIFSEQAIDNIIEPYMPVKEDGSPRVTLSSSISLVNRYCAKLPSDTFTRLTPRWKVKEVSENGCVKFECTIHLPINSPLKKPVMGVPMTSKQLAKMAAALKTCEELHKAGELDDNLLPTGKEAVKFEGELMEELKEEQSASCTARPGTTKRRQYYFKQVADAIKNSCPETGKPCFLYMFCMKLTCPIPEEQNTRGRKIHDPADTSRAFGILTSKPIPIICSFPVFTRSGEVTVYFEHLSSDIILTEEQLESLGYFHKYTFAEVLRLEKYPMIHDPSEAESSFFVVPVNESPESSVYTIDWKFVSTINSQKGNKPRKLLEEERQFFEFVEENYVDAVVMPWYRNLDKPQFFYVAEICRYLNPKSDFPDTGYETFENYYKKKYTISVMNCKQPLLDVDHTSARLNLLTPRYVNRKGVTLPTSSEQTKRTKRENLQQKQILVPELCIIHPFPASLWRKAVCLPCILYRVNSLLLAEQLRLSVAQAISVGSAVLPRDFVWPMLDFGWTLADVLKAQAALKEDESQSQEMPKVVQNPNFINEGDSFTIQNVSGDDMNSNHHNNQSYNVAEGDFEIDVFDPSKFDIPDDDFLVEQELRQINLVGDPFTSVPASNYPLWKPISEDGHSESPEMPMIRYGSPSNFEGEGWDSEWDTDLEDTTFFSLNLPGLGYISAPGVFNMESLSMDLASCRDDDLWDSMDEDSLFDESEFESSPAFMKSLPSVEQLCETQVQNKNFSKEICESEWLSACSLPMICEDKNENGESFDNCTKLHVAEKRESKMKEIKVLSIDGEEQNTKSSKSLENSALKFDNIYLAIQHIEESQTNVGSELRDMASIKNGDSCDQVLLEFMPNGDTIATQEEESTLAFGELLPNREEVEIAESDPFFRVYFDESPDLKVHPGPSPSLILQAFTMSNANDGINLERLETVGDSFLKYAITAYLFCMYPDIHEGKLSYLRSKQISNLNLYRLGKKKHLGELMVATKFEPNDNWLPPCYIVPKGLEQALIESGTPAGHWNIGNLKDLTQMSEEQIRQSVMEKKDINSNLSSSTLLPQNAKDSVPLIPYNLLTQHSIPDKSIADAVEALIGAYLISCGSRGALLFMSWLGLKVLPAVNSEDVRELTYGYLEPPPSPLLSYVPKAEEKLEKLLSGYSVFEKNIGYTFNDKSYLLQAFTHASYHYNKLTDCYQRLEFLGDAVLDYLITRHLYEDPKKHSPGTLTDLRSALVNNTFFASLAVKYDFHKYFKAISPGLFNVIKKFVELKEKDAGYENYEQAYYLEEEECEEAEEVEVPKALGDIFESVAGAIYLDSKMSLDTVWRVYFAMMKPEIEYFSTHVPKSPIRELLEMEPQTAKFERAEMTLSGKVRVRVEVFGKGQFVGVGRNKRIAKCTAAKRALRELKKMKKDKDSSKGS